MLIGNLTLFGLYYDNHLTFTCHTHPPLTKNEPCRIYESLFYALFGKVCTRSIQFKLNSLVNCCCIRTFLDTKLTLVSYGPGCSPGFSPALMSGFPGQNLAWSMWELEKHYCLFKSCVLKYIFVLLYGNFCTQRRHVTC